MSDLVENISSYKISLTTYKGRSGCGSGMVPPLQPFDPGRIKSCCDAFARLEANVSTILNRSCLLLPPPTMSHHCVGDRKPATCDTGGAITQLSPQSYELFQINSLVFAWIMHLQWLLLVPRYGETACSLALYRQGGSI